MNAITEMMQEQPRINEEVEMMLSLGRKIEEGDITKLLHSIACHYAATYEGGFDYMLSMRQAVYAKRRISPSMAKGILNCLRAELLKAGKQNDSRHGAEMAPAFLQAEPQAAEEQAPIKGKRNVHRKTYTEMQQSPWQSSSRGKSPIMDYIKAPRIEPRAVQMEEGLFGEAWQAWAAERAEAFRAAIEQEKALSL